MFSEDDLLPISALQHWVFCPRQCGLIHLERLWAENRFTAQGRRLHARAHDGPSETRPGVRIARGVSLRSLSLGLAGVGDVVEFHQADDNADPASTCAIPAWSGRWTPRPVEYKRGRPKRHDADRIQLCAQAICLEEMLDVGIPQGLLFYGQTRRREEVQLTPALRDRTGQIATAIRAMLQEDALPPPQPGKKCKSCSLRDACLPDRAGTTRAGRYMDRMLSAALRQTDSESDHPS